MKSFIVNLKKFFELNTGNSEINFNQSKRSLRIPLYQREFKWQDDKVTSLFNDITNRNKFLGLTILDECQNDYEIVDGQQRITVFYLILCCLYNYYHGKRLSQQEFNSLLKVNGQEYTLKNDSVGSFISCVDDVISIDITDNEDVYFQKASFERVYKLIENLVNNLDGSNAVQEFIRKFFDCELLVLINTEQAQSNPIEQVFLDINEKSQLLDVEDIFKGHCFENFSESQYETLRELWIRLKKCSAHFRSFGFSDLSHYLYLYLLFSENPKIQEKLTFEGKHILEGKSMDDTYELLQKMVEFGENITTLSRDLKRTDYIFANISPKSYEHRNTSDIALLRTLCLSILENQRAQYQKLPFMFFINQLRTLEDMKTEMQHDDFRQIVANLYVYSELFCLSRGKKSKDSLQRDMYETFQANPTDIRSGIECAKKIRREKVNDFEMRPDFTPDDLRTLYSIMDNYTAHNNWFQRTYTDKLEYTLEHFVVHDNRKMIVEWNADGRIIRFDLNALGLHDARSWKKRTANYLIMDKQLNESLRSFDIIEKINKIKEWYTNRGSSIPRHMQIYFDHIESLSSFVDLKCLKAENGDIDEIKIAYAKFVKEFFDESNEKRLLDQLLGGLRTAFTNEQASLR